MITRMLKQKKKRKIKKKEGKQRTLTRIQDHTCYVKLTSAKVSFVLNGNVPNKVKKKKKKMEEDSISMDWYSLSVPLLCFNVVDKKKKKNVHVYTLTKTRNQFMEIPRRLESWRSRSSLTHADKQHLNTTPQPRGKKEPRIVR